MTAVILTMIRSQYTHPHLLFFKATSKPFLHDWIRSCLLHLKPFTWAWCNNPFCFPEALICLLTQLCLCNTCTSNTIVLYFHLLTGISPTYVSVAHTTWNCTLVLSSVC